MQLIDSGRRSISVCGSNAPVCCLQATNKHKEVCWVIVRLTYSSSDENLNVRNMQKELNCQGFQWILDVGHKTQDELTILKEDINWAVVDVKRHRDGSVLFFS